MSDNINIVIIIIAIIIIIYFFKVFKRYLCKKEQNCESGQEVRLCEKCNLYTCHEHYQTPPESGDWDDPSNRGTNHYKCKCCGNEF